MACWNVSASTMATGSPTKRTRSEASGAWAKASCDLDEPVVGGHPELAPVNTAATPGAASASADFEAGDARVGLGRAHEHAVQRADQAEVIDVGAALGEQFRVFGASDTVAQDRSSHPETLRSPGDTRAVPYRPGRGRNRLRSSSVRAVGDDTVAALEIAWLEIADPPELWADLGYRVDDDGRCVIGSVEHRLVGSPEPGDGGRGGIVRWAVFGPEPATIVDGAIDGLPTLLVDPYRPDTDPDAGHPNGVFRIDHLVIATSDTPRTAAALAAVGLGRRGGRTTNSAGDDVDMTFFWAGSGADGDAVLLELSGPPTPAPEPKPARFRGIAYSCHDLDATVAYLTGRTTEPRPAVQAGRRIAALTGAAGSTLPMAFMTPHVRT